MRQNDRKNCTRWNATSLPDKRRFFIETPYRNNKLVAELSQQLRGDLRLCVACDVTGATEEITTRPVREWAKAKYNYDKRPAIFLIYR